MSFRRALAQASLYGYSEVGKRRKKRHKRPKTPKPKGPSKRRVFVTELAKLDEDAVINAPTRKLQALAKSMQLTVDSLLKAAHESDELSPEHREALILEIAIKKKRLTNA